jgi:hypothetical protein
LVDGGEGEVKAMTNLPRRRVQLHLSTALILMFAAGGLIWANTVKHDWGNNSLYSQGFPFFYYYNHGYQETMGYVLGPLEPITLAENILFAAGVLFEIAWVIESIISKQRWSRIVYYAFIGTAALFLFMPVLDNVLRPFVGHHYRK